jgi:ring-1,2-phenylacetyl-CoA epoxidase subunit PaaE
MNNSSSLFHPLRVRAIEPDTDEAVVVAFDVPEALRAVFAFNQGQYLTLRTQVDGQDLRRSYSICAGIDEGELRVGVRKVAGGVFSNWINERLKPGDSVQVMPPQGRFFVPLDPSARRHYLGVAGGSGITPILSIMKTVLGREPKARFTLIYANRSAKSTMFKEEIEDVKNRYMARLVLHHVFSGEDTELPLHSGVMNRDKLREFLGRLVDASSIDHAFVCGPYQMNDEAEAALLAAGVPEERIHIERFGVAPQAAGPAAAAGAVEHEVKPGDADRARIVIIRDGLRREFDFVKDNPSILDAASSAGLEVPFSCTSGVCGTCRAKLVEGQVRMTRNFALDKAEVAGGFVLTCQSHPLTDRVVLSFDDR